MNLYNYEDYNWNDRDYVSEQTLTVRLYNYKWYCMYTYVHHMHYALVQEESVRGSKSNSEGDALAEWCRVKDEQDIEYQQAQLKKDQATVKQLYYLFGAFNIWDFVQEENKANTEVQYVLADYTLWYIMCTF